MVRSTQCKTNGNVNCHSGERRIGRYRNVRCNQPVADTEVSRKPKTEMTTKDCPLIWNREYIVRCKLYINFCFLLSLTLSRPGRYIRQRCCQLQRGQFCKVAVHLFRKWVNVPKPCPPFHRLEPCLKAPGIIVRAVPRLPDE